MKNKFLNYGTWMIFFATILWATDAPFRSQLVLDLPSNLIVFIEHAINLLFALPILIWNWKYIKTLSKMEWLAVVAIGVGGSALASIAFTQAFHYVNPSVAILLQKLQPIVAILLAGFLLSEKLTKKFWIFACVALAGAYVISFPDLIPRVYVGEVFNPNFIGVSLSLIAAILWGAATVFGKYVLNKAKVTFKALTALRFCVGAIFLLILNIFQNNLPKLTKITSHDWLFLVIIALVSGFFSLLIYYKGLTTTKASVATIAELGFVFASLIINRIFIGGVLTFSQIIGMLVLLASILGLSYLRSKDETKNTTEVVV